MTSTLFACDSHSDDPEASDRHYAEVHSTRGLALPRLRSFTGTHPAVAGAGVDLMTGFTTVDS